MLLMQQHSALEKSDRAKGEGRYEEAREGRGGEGGNRRKGEGRARTLHVSLLSPNIAFGKEKNEATAKSGWELVCDGSK